MNDVLVERSAPRLAGIVATLDRVFPLLWLGIYVLLPVSGWAAEMFESWFDQRRDLVALQELIANGRAQAIVDNGIGPAYIGAAALVHGVLGLDPQDSLIFLTRASYALSVAAGLVLVRVFVTRWGRTPPMVSLASQFVFIGLVFAAGTWYWSDVPWSHFFAAFLAVAFYAARFGPARPSTAYAVVAGILLAVLAATRSFELLAVVLAWGLASIAFAALRLSPFVWSLRRALVGASAFVVTTAVVYGTTGKRDVFFLYSEHLDRQSGSLSGVEVAQTPTLSLGLVPVKLVQLFVDPCYLSLCRISDYEAGGGAGTNLDLWSLPLAIQLPMLLLLPICLVALGVLVVRSVRRRVAGTHVRPLAEMTIAATGLVIGYAGSTLTGPSHLRYGFARDFLLPALLVAIVAVVLGARALWGALAGRGRVVRGSPEIAFVLGAVVVAVVVVGVTTVARSTGLPRIESRHLGAVTYTARCSDRECVVRVVSTTTAGEPISIPGASTLTFGCGSDSPRFTIFTANVGEPVGIASTCSDPRLVAAWPTVMGLPPGSFELAAVKVRNA